MREQALEEEALVRAFIQQPRQDRCLHMLTHPKRREVFRSELAHFKWLNDGYASAIASSTAHTAREIAALVRRKGSGTTVWVVSEDLGVDGKEMDLEAALNHIWGRGIGTLLSCVPGKPG